MESERKAIEWTIPYRPFQPHQQTFLQNSIDRRISAFFAGLQSGKSVAGAIALFTLLYILKLKLPKQSSHLNPEVWILSKSYTLVDTAFEYFRAVAGPMLYTNDECRKMGLQRGDSRTFWLHPNENGGKPIRLRCRTAADPESLRATPVLLAAWCDEVAFWKETAWLNLQGRGIVTPTKYLITTTPKGKNWLYQDVYLPGMSGAEPIGVVTCRSVDNPYADKTYLEKLRKKFGPAYSAQELDGLFTQATGYVYDFDRVRDCFDVLPSEDPAMYKARVIGLDPGYGDPYAAALLLKDWDNLWWQADEMYLPEKAIVDDAYPVLKQWCDRWKVTDIYCDKRRPADWQGLKRRKLPAGPNMEVFGEDGRRTVMPMIRMVQRLFREGRFKINRSCEWTCEEAENYAFPDREERNQGENPIDYRNHVMDAWRYGICSVDSLAEDRRPRYRGGADMKPRAKGLPPQDPRKLKYVPTVADMLAAQDAKFDARERPGRRG